MLAQTERIEGKMVLSIDQVIHCAQGHELLIKHRSPIFAEISAGPFDYSSGCAVGVTHVDMVPVPQEGMEVDIICPKCPPDSSPVHLIFHLIPGHKFRTYTEVVNQK